MDPHAKGILCTLLAKGYFPKELPPVFTTQDFGENSEAIIADWRAAKLFEIKSAKNFKKINGKRFRGRYGYNGLVSADPEIISKPKRLYERRNIHITHPIPQALLVWEISSNWRKLQKFLALRRYSEDKINVSDRFDRSIEGINFPLHRAKTSYIESSANWLVRTDISRFYPSIYTHSIPWAAYGKEAVKASLDTFSGSFADRLDVLVRACNRNQTVGIPIGPESSRIIAEIISSRIDDEFATRLERVTRDRVDRLQDDWVVGAPTLEEAETILSTISAAYREFGLEINGSKTSVTHILASHAEDWKSEISSFLSHRSGGLQGSRLQGFLDLCLRLQLSSPTAPVVNYSLAIIEGRKFSRDDTQRLESFLMKAAAVSPGSVDRVCRILLNLQHDTGSISRSRVASRFVELAERHIENGALYEVIWLLYTVRGLKKSVHIGRLVEASENIPSSALRLLLMDMKDRGICINRLPVPRWEQDATEDSVLSDWSWLYAYEAMRKGWMNDPKGLLGKSFFEPMHRRDVVFYDPKRNVKNSKKVKQASIALRKQQNFLVSSWLNVLRGVDETFDFGGGEY